MMILAFDLDGTTLNTDKKISGRNFMALEAAQQNNIILVPATGRVRSFIPAKLFSLPSLRYLITANGADIYDIMDKRSIYKNTIAQRDMVRLIEYLKAQRVYIEIYIDGEVWSEIYKKEEIFNLYKIPRQRYVFLEKEFNYTSSLRGLIDDDSYKVEKVNLPYVDEHKRKKIWKDLENMGLFYLASSLPNNIEITNRTSNKGNALRFLSERLNVPRSDIMAVGDSGNDMEMLEYAQISVAMGNAVEEVKQVARYETEDCDNDGFASAVEKHLIKG